MLDINITCFACFISFRCLTHICLERDRFGGNDVLCSDVEIYCVSVHAVAYYRPGNMSDGAMVYTAVCFYMD